MFSRTSAQQENGSGLKGQTLVTYVRNTAKTFNERKGVFGKERGANGEKNKIKGAVAGGWSRHRRALA